MAGEDWKYVKSQELYDNILQWANRFLYSCSHIRIEKLQTANPTFAEIAEQLENMSKIIIVLCDSSDPMMGQKAAEYCLLMRQMAVAITNNDEQELSELVDEMKLKPGV